MTEDGENQETRKAGDGERKSENSQRALCTVGRPLLWGPLLGLSRCIGARPINICLALRLALPRIIAALLVRNCGTRRPGKMDDFKALEADFATPFFKISGGIIERVAEFDQHV